MAVAVSYLKNCNGTTVRLCEWMLKKTEYSISEDQSMFI